MLAVLACDFKGEVSRSPEVLKAVKDRMSKFVVVFLWSFFLSKRRFFDTWTNQKIVLNYATLIIEKNHC